MKNLFFGAVFALFSLTSFTINELPNENLPITETIMIADDVSPPGLCFIIGNMVFDLLGESPESVDVANALCAFLGV